MQLIQKKKIKNVAQLVRFACEPALSPGAKLQSGCGIFLILRKKITTFVSQTQGHLLVRITLKVYISF